MLILADDYPVHQTPAPLAHLATSDRNAYDRYFFNGYDAGGEIFFAVALGLYPNREVVDAAVSVLRDGVQRSVHVSGRLGRERAAAVGPLRIEFVEPMRTVRIVADTGDLGLTADITFHARTPAVEEPRFTVHQGSRVWFDYTRLTQWGDWEGELTLDGHRQRLDRAVHLGTRDRSWGVRPVGEQPEPGVPLSELPQFFWLWGPVHLPDRCAHFDVNEYGDGRRWHEFGALVPQLGPDGNPAATDGVEPMRTVDYDIDWEPGTRRSRSARVTLHRWNADPVEISFEPVLTFPMAGVGYPGSDWPHGVWQGELATGTSTVVVADLPPSAIAALHVQQLCRVTMDGQTGVGVLEQMALNEHLPSGLTGLVDGAPEG